MQHEHAFRYVECDVPQGMTLDSWRSARDAPPPRRRLVRLSSLRPGRRARVVRARETF